MLEASTAPGLPHGWRDVVLGDLGEFSTSSVDKKVNTAELPVRLVNYMDVYRSPYLTSQLDYMQVTASRPEIAKSQVLEGDLLFTPSSETPDDVGHSAVVVEALPETLHSYHTVRLRIAASEAIDLRFRGRFANSSLVLKHFEKCATGSTRYTLSLADFRSAPVRIPPIAEQAKIAQVLDTLDTTIRQTDAIIEKLKLVKQGLLHDLLTRGIDANGELRPPQSQAPHLYKNSPLGWIPTEWTVGPLSDWIEGRPKNGYSPQPAGRWTGVQMLGLGCLTANGFEPRQLKDAPIGDPLVAKAFLVPGDLLMSRANTRELVGLVGSYRDVGTPCCYPDLMMRLTPTTKTSAPFLELVLRFPRTRRQIEASASGTSGSMVKISSSIVLRLCVAMPMLAEQHRILDCLSAADTRLALETAGMEQLQALKSGLMDDLLTGCVRVTPLIQGRGQLPIVKST